MPSKQWVFDPDGGGVKIKDAVKYRMEHRIQYYAKTNFAGRYTRLDVRFRSQFCYVDAYTEPEPPGPDWPPAGWTETREAYLERLRNTPTHLFRLRFFGDEDSWGLAFYSYASDKYELSVFPTGEFFGTPEAAFQTAGDFHL